MSGGTVIPFGPNAGHGAQLPPAEALPPVRPERDYALEPAAASGHVSALPWGARIWSFGWVRKGLILVVLALAWQLAALWQDNDLLLPTFTASAQALVQGLASGELLGKAANVVFAGFIGKQLPAGLRVEQIVAGLRGTGRPIGDDHASAGHQSRSQEGARIGQVRFNHSAAASDRARSYAPMPRSHLRCFNPLGSKHSDRHVDVRLARHALAHVVQIDAVLERWRHQQQGRDELA